MMESDIGCHHFHPSVVSNPHQNNETQYKIGIHPLIEYSTKIIKLDKINERMRKS